jgi:hypothetical protein
MRFEVEMNLDQKLLVFDLLFCPHALVDEQQKAEQRSKNSASYGSTTSTAAASNFCVFVAFVVN